MGKVEPNRSGEIGLVVAVSKLKIGRNFNLRHQISAVTKGVWVFHWRFVWIFDKISAELRK